MTYVPYFEKDMFMSQEPSVRGQYMSILRLTHDSYNSQVRIQDVPGARREVWSVAHWQMQRAVVSLYNVTNLLRRKQKGKLPGFKVLRTTVSVLMRWLLASLDAHALRHHNTGPDRPTCTLPLRMGPHASWATPKASRLHIIGNKTLPKLGRVAWRFQRRTQCWSRRNI